MPEENKSPFGRAEAGPGELSETSERVRIYFLPNLLTAGNLACGFFAVTWIFKYTGGTDFAPIWSAIKLILGAFVFDFLDGFVARLGRKESQFGREFDSLADIVSFGVAPACLVYQVVLYQFKQTGWVISAIYLLCGGIRLARFNILSMRGSKPVKGEFVGFPIPSAAALVVSVTMFIMSLVGEGRELGPSRFILPVLLLLLSALMVSSVRYPTLKYISWTRARSAAAFAAVMVLALALFANFQITLALLFVAYMLYGLIRPWVSKRWQKEIESDEADEDGEEA